ncbi:hypothetical protein UJ101_02152 [Flavobacteriaceae bacterium UJ101]|nr:hypothetical protein UJ101_02152 [Flavobacteriaceae bacterium UJ101]
MNNIKTIFTIKDLENISGIKAHTIRIWEKRYNLLSPNRTETNIRYYSLENLQKLLNIALLNKNKYKISKIAEMSDNQIKITARELSFKLAINEEAINSFKLSMFQFDRELFDKTYNKLLNKKTFRALFKDVFVPFLDHVGLLWQTDTLSPAHEHFISNLIIQKIQINIEKLQYTVSNEEIKYVLFLPEGEIHEIGLLYLNYELTLRGFNTIYLGQSLPLANLNYFIKEASVVFVSVMTIRPYREDLETYFKKIEALLKNTNHQFISVSNRDLPFEMSSLQTNIKVYSSIMDFLEHI